MQVKDIITKKFLENLSIIGLSKNTLKFYKSDLNHFSAWILLKIRNQGISAESLTGAINFINPSLTKEYISYLTKNHVANKTIKRKLSTLRHFSRFLCDERIIENDFVCDNNNKSQSNQAEAQKLMDNFVSELKHHNVSNNTIKNYLADVRHFLNWMEAKI